jgi:hypothetical protein
MSIVLDGNGAITGLTATGISAVQNVGYANLPSGSVLQVVSTVNSTSYSGTSGAEVYTGMSASITPKYSTSKILVIFATNQSLSTPTNNAAAVFLLRRGTSTGATLMTQTRVGAYRGGGLIQVGSAMTLSVLDSPATTSAVIYGIFESNIDGTNTWELNQSGGISNLTILEIAG